VNHYPSVLYVGNDSALESDELNALNDRGIRLVSRTPAELCEAADVGEPQLILLDNRFLGSRVPGVARRLRWFGYSGRMLLVDGGYSDLERAIALDHGVDDIVSAPISIKTMIAYCTAQVPDDGRVHAPTEWHGGVNGTTDVTKPTLMSFT